MPVLEPVVSSHGPQVVRVPADDPRSSLRIVFALDTKAGPRAVRRNADDLRSMAADNGFQDWHTEYEIASLGVEYLVQHQGSRSLAVANNALIRAKGYTQRWMPETSYSTIKRTQGGVLRSRFWYRQFREIVLLFALNNIKKLVGTL